MREDHRTAAGERFANTRLPIPREPPRTERDGVAKIDGEHEPLVLLKNSRERFAEHMEDFIAFRFGDDQGGFDLQQVLRTPAKPKMTLRFMASSRMSLVSWSSGMRLSGSFTNSTPMCRPTCRMSPISGNSLCSSLQPFVQVRAHLVDAVEDLVALDDLDQLQGADLRQRIVGEGVQFLRVWLEAVQAVADKVTPAAGRRPRPCPGR